MRRLGLISEKGGVAKTTTAINLAVGLAKRDARVLLVDCDPQANASLVMLEGRGADAATVGAVLLGDASAREAIHSTRTPGLEFLPSAVSLADDVDALHDKVGRERRLRVALETVEQAYDYVILDTSPTRSLLTVNALVYVAEAYVPIDPGVFAISGLGNLQAMIDDVRQYLDNRALRIAGIILTRCIGTKVSRDVARQLREFFGDLVLPTTIPANAKVEEAHSRYQSVLDYAPRSAGAKAYDQLVTEIINDGQREQGLGGSSEGIAPNHDAA